MQPIYDLFLKCGGASTDTRTLKEGDMFFALKGPNFDGNKFVQAALDAGAKYAVVSDPELAQNKRCVIVDDTLRTLQELAARHRQEVNPIVVGLTGTNGKTTTKELIAAVLAKKYKVTATKGNLNNHIGVPLTLLSLKRGDVDVAVVEMGASHPGEIAELCQMVKPTHGLITNVGLAHTEGFGSLEGMLQTKSALYDAVKENGGTIFVNRGNDILYDIIKDYRNLKTYAVASETLKGQATVVGKLCDGAEADETLKFDWSRAGLTWRTVRTRLCGNYNMENALAAVCLGDFMGVPTADICEAIEGYTPTNGRSQMAQGKRNRLIVDAYNANPSSMEASLRNFGAMRADNKLVILGAMRELGALEEEKHRWLLEEVRRQGVAEGIFVGREFDAVKDGFPEFQFVAEANEIDTESIAGKYILLKGSHSNRLDLLVDKL